MTEFTLYFVAWYKHDAPQHLVAGPFIDGFEAQGKAEDLGSRYCVVETTLPMKETAY